MNDILAKVFTSSADPTKVSTMVKGVLLSFAPMIMLVLGLQQSDYSVLVDAIERIVFYGTSLVAVLQIALGAARKINLGRWSHPDA